MNLHILYRNAQLHCFIERKNKIKLDLKQINRILQSKMTHYELPNILYSINLLPRNKNDKIDKDYVSQSIQNAEKELLDKNIEDQKRFLISQKIDVLKSISSN